jgi:hypothetical protein
MIKVTNKKGSGQFEMVISFVFFVGFVFFLFMFLTPEDTTTLSGAVISGLHDSFEEKAYTNLSSLFLITKENQDTCFYINLPDNLFEYTVSEGDSRVVKLSGQDVTSDFKGGNLNIESGQSFRVAISPEFDDGDLSLCSSVSDYSIGSTIEKRVISYSSLENMHIKYYDDYPSLKRDLGVPAIYEFAIFPEEMRELEMQPKSGIPDAVEVLAKDYIFEVLRSDGTFTNERINFRIW